MNCPICKVDTNKPMSHMMDHMTGRAKKSAVEKDHAGHDHVSCPMCSVQLHSKEELAQHAAQMHPKGATK